VGGAPAAASGRGSTLVGQGSCVCVCRYRAPLGPLTPASQKSGVTTHTYNLGHENGDRTAITVVIDQAGQATVSVVPNQRKRKKEERKKKVKRN
jgi:hypothetical protein